MISLEDAVVQMKPEFKKQNLFTRQEIIDIAKDKYPTLTEGQLKRFTLKAYHLHILEIINVGRHKKYRLRD